MKNQIPIRQSRFTLHASRYILHSSFFILHLLFFIPHFHSSCLTIEDALTERAFVAIQTSPRYRSAERSSERKRALVASPCPQWRFRAIEIFSQQIHTNYRKERV